MVLLVSLVPSVAWGGDAAGVRSVPAIAVLDAGTRVRGAAADVRDAAVAAGNDAAVITIPVEPAPWVGGQTGRPQRPPVGRVARVVIGLFALLALAVAAGHPAVRAFERRTGLGMFVATGLPFLVLGAVARLPALGILSEGIVRDLRPILEFGLGWIGFRVGTEFDVREIDRLPRGTGRLLAMQGVAAFVAAGLGSVAALGMVGAPVYGGAFLRDGLILGACAAVSAPSGARALEAIGVLDDRGSRLIRKIAVLDDVIPIFVLCLVTSVFRPVDVGRWYLPALGWVFLQVGMGAALGALTVALVRSTPSPTQEVALTVGAVAFAAGMAGYLGFSPMVVGCVAGVVLTNVGGEGSTGAFAEQLRNLERPIYMTFFAIAGAMWEVTDWRGWAIVPLFVIARLFGKLLGARMAFVAEEVLPTTPDADGSKREDNAFGNSLESIPDGRTLGIALIPTSAVSIAVMVGARQAYPDSMAPYLETVVIMGAVAAELVLQFTVPSMRKEKELTQQNDGPKTPSGGGG